MAGFREFLTGEVLTAANVNSFLMNQSVMVFADGAARDSALGTAIASGNALVEGMLTYNSDTSKLEIYNGTSWAGVSAVKKIEAFTSSGTWTVPAGVTYAIAHMLGGGGGIGTTDSGGNGGNSSVGFAGGTVTATGATKGLENDSTTPSGAVAGAANSGKGAKSFRTNATTANAQQGDAQWIVAGGDVTPAASITVTVGAGGAAGTGGAAGGTGYVYIEYYE